MQETARANGVYPSCILFHNPGIKTQADWNAAGSFVNGACMRRNDTSNDSISIPPQLLQFTDTLVVGGFATCFVEEYTCWVRNLFSALHTW